MLTIAVHFTNTFDSKFTQHRKSGGNRYRVWIWCEQTKESISWTSVNVLADSHHRKTHGGLWSVTQVALVVAIPLYGASESKA